MRGRVGDSPVSTAGFPDDTDRTPEIVRETLEKEKWDRAYYQALEERPKKMRKAIRDTIRKAERKEKLNNEWIPSDRPIPRDHFFEDEIEAKFYRENEPTKEKWHEIEEWDGAIDNQEAVLEDHVSKNGWIF